MNICSAVPDIFLLLRSQSRCFSYLKKESASSAAEYWEHLRKSSINVEKTLATSHKKLDLRCVSEVIYRCSLDLHHLLGLRFFVWSGLQRHYRHSSYMYTKACKLFQIDANPQILSDLIEAYKAEGCLASVRTFKVILNLCREAKLADQSLGVMRKMAEFDCYPDTCIFNVVLRLFCEKGDMDTAVQLMKEMNSISLCPDMVSYIVLVKGFCKLDRFDDAHDLFERMKEQRCIPNTVLFSALLSGFCKCGRTDRALALIDDMEKVGDDCKPNVVTYTSVIQSFCEEGKSMEAVSVLDRMIAHGCSPNRVTICVLSKGLCTEGHVDVAYKLVDRIVIEGSVSSSDCYSSLMVSLLRIGDVDEAERIIRMMLVREVRPDSLACSVLIKELCVRKGGLEAFMLCEEIERISCLSLIDSDVYSILMDKLFQERCLVEASKLARIMLEKGVHLRSPYSGYVAELFKNVGVKGVVL